MSGLIMKVETQFIMEMMKRKPETPRIEKVDSLLRSDFSCLG